MTSNHKYLIAGLLLGLALSWVYHNRASRGGAGE